MARYPTGEVKSFTCDAVGNLLTRTDSIYTYDPNDRLESVTDPTGTTVVCDYNEAGEITGKTIDGQATGTEYDEAGRPHFYTDALGFRYEYVYDDAGRLLELRGPSCVTIYERDTPAGGRRPSSHRPAPEVPG